MDEHDSRGGNNVYSEWRFGIMAVEKKIFDGLCKIKVTRRT